VGERLGQVAVYGIVTVGAGESHILNICVSPQTQGRGYGRLMMEKLMDVAASHGAEMMILEVRPSNERAIELYRKLGFNEIGLRKGYYPAKNGREDAIVFAKML
jgi:ribosomal-protein-alanine N-acetyltransferase